MKINTNYQNLKDNYLFAEIARRVNEYKANNPSADVISLGIGDVTLPLPAACVEAMEKASAEMGTPEGFRGYGPDHGYEFLSSAIQNYYKRFNVSLELKEIFVSDGAKSDISNILDIFSADNTVLIPDPVYPVYLDTNIMDGRKIVFINANEENDFLPLPDKSIKADIIYICSPNNPTGAVYEREQLKAWVDYALDNKAVILYDAAYEAFISDPDLPHSIYEIDGAKKCAIELCSLSKIAGFTGTRCGYTIVPFDLKSGDISLNAMWLRRKGTKFNGVPYIIQRGAEAVFSDEGFKQCMQNIDYYMQNAKLIADALDELSIKYIGGKNSPYIWLKCPGGRKSWEFFDYLLNNANIVGTPGAGFGENGEGFFRLTSFGSHENIIKAVDRIKKLDF